MLYSIEAGVNASPHSIPSEAGEFDESLPPYKRTRRGLPPGSVSLAGLAATTPHQPYGTVNNSSGGLTTQGQGGGSPPQGETAIALTSPPVNHTIGRNSSIFQVKGKSPQLTSRRYQPSSQGPRVSRGEALGPVSKAGAAFPGGGLFGLSDIGGGILDWLKNRVTPPGGKISRVTIIPNNVRNVVPTPLRTAVRYAGAATQTVLFPVLTGSQQRRIFGLDSGESKVFMKGQQIMRAVDAAILTYGVSTGAYTPGLLVPGSGGATQHAAMYAASQNATTAYAAGLKTPAYAASANPLNLSLNAAPATYGTSSLTTPVATAGQFSYTPAQVAASTAQGGGVLSALGSGAKVAGSTISQTLLPLAVVKMLGGGPGLAPNYSEDGGTSVVVAPPQSGGETPYGGSGSFGGGGSSGGGEAAQEPILAGYSPATLLIVGGLAVTVAVKMFKGRK